MTTYFISHGGPDIILKPSPAREFLEGFGATLGTPRAVVVVSAHFMTTRPAVDADPKPKMIYDFGGFPDELYTMQYPAPGEPDLAKRAAGLMHEAGLNPALVGSRGFDHGTWVPMKMIYPQAQVPVVQVAVQPRENATHHYKVGQALRTLADEGVAIVGSGSATHNLYEFFNSRHGPDDEAEGWVAEFGEWLNDKVSKGDLDALLDYRAQAPSAVLNHPTDEHLMPLFVALGAAGEGAKGKRIHQSTQGGVLMMDAYSFAA